ncbi:MAG: glutamate--tRNA ligase [Pseudomonadota bacterium]
MSAPVVTRFAPSPTGLLHLGNARTALFNWLYARRHGGRFLLRIEDTDAARSTDASCSALLEDLQWLGFDWDAGPGRDDERGPYFQSARASIYRDAYARLEAAGHAYPCWCSAEALELQRRLQLAAGRPPRYAGTCARLGPDARARRAEAGEPATLRFQVTADRAVEFDDLVRGPQQFAAADLGDFVIRRADGSASFLFCNAVDDAAMGVTHVFRGEDHVANTPRQLLVLAALGLPAPRYGHLPLLVGADGAPLSKRHGSASVADVRAEGFLPEAVLNLLGRLGHTYAAEGWLDAGARIAGFDADSLGRAPAHFDPAQLRHWQKEAVQRASADAHVPWVRHRVPAGEEARVLAAVRANLVLPTDAAEWAHVVYGELPCAGGEAREAIARGGPEFFDVALAAHAEVADYAALVSALKARTGRKGRELFQPLRAALTHRLDGPELAALLDLMPRATVRARLESARRIAA